MTTPMLELINLSKHFLTRNGFGRQTGLVKAVDSVSLRIEKGGIYGLAGESGSGKSTIARMIMGLARPTSGDILLDGETVTGQSGTRAYGRKVQMVFQNPGSSLNPRRSIGASISVPLEAHGHPRTTRRQRISELLEMVQLPVNFAERYPHELSGGQKQRVAIARALAVAPKLLVLDEPTSALDVSVQARVIDLLVDLGRELGLTYLFISHDLSLMRNFAERVGVLYRGQIVETGPVDQVFEHPRHDYTRLLLASVPVISAEEEAMRPKIPLIDGEIPTAEQLIALRGRSGTSLPKDRNMIRIGIDVGGTNTDAVVMDGATVIAGVKAATTADVMTGVVNALKAVLDASKMQASAIDVVMIGTTHFTNAVVQRRDLAKTAAVRLGLPATASLPPMVDWPEDLKVAIGGTGYLAHGGNEFDGRVISPLDEAELLGIAEDIKSKGINTIAITSVFSPVTNDFEKQAGEILAKALPGVHITLSSDIGRIGLLERENAAIMNACLRDLSKHVIQAFRKAITETGIKGRFYLTQNDGTLMDAEFAEKFPVLTFASGPTNSMRGAAFLSGVADAIVVDIGGTTSDVGSLHKGFPRQATVAVEVGGVRTNFRMPDVFSIGLGGGSHVVESSGDIKVGPTSVGYRIVTEALIFGGKTLTTSDVVVASGRYELGDKSKVAHLTPDFIARTQAKIMSMLEDCVERSRLSPDPLPVIVVGGGSILVDGPIGGLEVIKPNHFAVANAVGAAIAQVSGEVDRVYALAEIGRDEALADAKQRATEAAVAAGALRSSIEIVDVEDVPLAYLPGNATRVRVKAVGELHVG